MTEQRIRELARDLTPVKPIPRLRTAAASVLAIWALVLAADWATGGAGPRPLRDAAWASPSYLAALAGVVLVGFGALGAALASVVPGRAAAARLGLRVTALGVALAAAGWVFGFAAGAPEHAGEDLGSIFACSSRALALGLVPALLCAGFAGHAALRRAGLTAGLSLAAGVALGAAAVHASCPSNSPLHQLLAHAVAPAAQVAALTAPLALLMSRWARRG
jgi:hypothetical protein